MVTTESKFLNFSIASRKARDFSLPKSWKHFRRRISTWRYLANLLGHRCIRAKRRDSRLEQHSKSRIVNRLDDRLLLLPSLFVLGNSATPRWKPLFTWAWWTVLRFGPSWFYLLPCPNLWTQFSPEFDQSWRYFAACFIDHHFPYGSQFRADCCPPTFDRTY
jgi:hypothetical protein